MYLNVLENQTLCTGMYWKNKYHIGFFFGPIFPLFISSGRVLGRFRKSIFQIFFNHGEGTSMTEIIKLKHSGAFEKVNFLNFPNFPNFLRRGVVSRPNLY